MRSGASGEKSLSKSALKNQKKREAKKAAKQVSRRQPVRRLALCQTGNCQTATSSLLFKHTVSHVLLQEAKPDREAPSDPTPVRNSQSEPSSGDPDTDKKIKNIKKVKNL